MKQKTLIVKSGIPVVYGGEDVNGIEIDPDYFQIACKRIEVAQRQQTMEFAE